MLTFKLGSIRLLEKKELRKWGKKVALSANISTGQGQKHSKAGGEQGFFSAVLLLHLW